MQCSQCGTVNPAGNKFCGVCGARSPLVAPHAGWPTPAGMRLRIRAGLLAKANDQETGTAFAAALKPLRELGSPYHLAVGLLDHAEHSVTVGDLQIVRQLAAEAETIALRLSAKPLVQRAQNFTTSFLEPPAIATSSG